MRKETLLLLLSTAFALVLAEIVLSRLFPQRTVNQYLEDRPAMFRANDALFMDMKPGFTGYLKEEEFRTDVSINSLGYRQGEFDLERGAEQRVLVVGDSFTFGFGVEERDGYVQVMERTLNEQASPPVETINAGVPAWWTDAYYVYLKTRGLALNPNVVVLGLFMGNDIDARDARYAIWPEVDDEGLPLAVTSERVRIEDGHRVRSKRRARWKIPVLRNSHLFQLLYSSGKNIGRLFSPKVQASTLYESTYSEETEAIITKVQKLILGMAEDTHGIGAQFVVAMIPERQQVYPGRKSAALALDLAKPHRLFAGFLAQHAIPTIDLLPVMRAAAETSDEDLYYTKDSHFTRTGYRAAGEAIGRFLLDQGLVTTPHQ